jgi:hypothetical protein
MMIDRISGLSAVQPVSERMAIAIAAIAAVNRMPGRSGGSVASELVPRSSAVVFDLMKFPKYSRCVENHSPLRKRTNPIDKFCDIVRKNRMMAQ